MGKVDFEKFSKEELEKIVAESNDKTELATKLGFTFSNGKVNKKVIALLEKFEISISHFDSKKKVKARRKYSIIKKNCPVCGNEFETQDGAPKEKITCSYSCANIYFSNQKHGPEQRLKTSHTLLNTYNSTMETELVGNEVQYKKECELCKEIYFTLDQYQIFCCRSCAVRDNWKDENYRNNIINKTNERVRSGIHKGWAYRSRLNPSFPEKITIEVLNELGFSLARELHVGSWYIDFADVNRKIAIEIDGRQHELPEQKAKDKIKDDYLVSYGWKVFRIKWQKLTKEFRDELKNKIIMILK